jgi:hypothetical protein
MAAVGWPTNGNVRQRAVRLWAALSTGRAARSPRIPSTPPLPPLSPLPPWRLRVGTTLEIQAHTFEPDGKILVVNKGVERFKVTKVQAAAAARPRRRPWRRGRRGGERSGRG